MAKWYGKIGYAEGTVETTPGIWEEAIIERSYYGDIIRDTSKYQNSSSINGEVDIANRLSIVADPYAMQNFHAMRYVEFMGVKRLVTTVEVQYPRLLLSIGGIYNVAETGTTDIT